MRGYIDIIVYDETLLLFKCGDGNYKVVLMAVKKE